MSTEGWHPDPFGRVQERFHDGLAWTSYGRNGTEHVLDDPDPDLAAASRLPPTPPRTGVRRPWAPAQRGYADDGGFVDLGPDGSNVGSVADPARPSPVPEAPPEVPPVPPVPPVRVAEGHLLEAPVLVLRERPPAGPIDVAERYDVLAADGALLGRVRLLGQTRVELRDAAETVLLTADRRAGSRGDDVVTVRDAALREVGRMVRGREGLRQRYTFLVPAAEVEDPSSGSAQLPVPVPVGTMGADEAKSWRFRFTDGAGRVVARTDGAVGELPDVALNLQVTAHHALVVEPDVAGPLRSLTVMAAVLVDASARPLAGWTGYFAKAPGWQL